MNDALRPRPPAASTDRAIEELLNPMAGGLEQGPSLVRPAPSPLARRIRGMDNFGRVFAIRPGEKVLILADHLLDPRVIEAIRSLATARGATTRVIVEPSTAIDAVPEHWKAVIAQADFVASTWFNSVTDPYFIGLRKGGQRWVKITYFRDLDMLESPQACYPLDVLGEILKATARRFPERGDFDLQFFDDHGTDFRIRFTEAMRTNLLSQNRWKGDVTAAVPGCYAHYVPLHGPNLWDRTSVRMDPTAHVEMTGTIWFQAAVGFGKPFARRIGLRFDGDTVIGVEGDDPEAGILRGDLIGGRLIELGCGFNPGCARYDIHPAGSNAPGALHFGIDLPTPSRYMRLAMPLWEEPPVHHDLCVFDVSVKAGDTLLIDRGFLCALRDDEVVACAARFGDPLALLEGWPMPY